MQISSQNKGQEEDKKVVYQKGIVPERDEGKKTFSNK